MQPSSFPLQLTVLRAQNLPHHKTISRKECRFYVTVIAGARTWHTRAVRSMGNRVEWNEDAGLFTVLPHSRVAISLYAKRAMQKDILVGTQEIPCEPQRELDIIFGNADRHPGHLTEPAIPYITITMSANPSLSVTAADNAPIPRMVDQDNPVAEEGAPHSADTTRPAAAANAISSSLTGAVPIEGGTPVASMEDSQTEMSRTLDRAGEALDTVNTWKTTANTIKWVMDTVSPILKLNPYASLAWSLFSKIPETLLHQFQLDDNVRTLLTAIQDAFEFAKDADVLTSIRQGSTQAKILEEMLQCVSESAEFIESYAKDVKVGKRVFKNIGGQLDDKVETYRTTFVRLHKKFLTYVNVIAGAAVIEIRDDMRAQLTERSNRALETGLRAIIGETPVIGGWRFNDRKGCHPGTRQDFLHHIIEWVGNPKSERGLVLFGQAGTGKSSIAHEVASLFDKNCLGSYVAFRRNEESKDDGYHLFTTLSRDLCDRYPPFKVALGKAVIGNSSFRSTRDYPRLFEWLLLEPLKYLQLDGTILIVIDALDESGITIGKNGLHTFLAQHLIDLPPNFRVLITTRPEHGIEPAFANAQSVRILYMNDAQLAADTEQDIGIYLQNELPEEVFKEHGDRLAKGSEGLFQWAAVASGFINSPDNLGIGVKKVIQRLLGHSRGCGGGLLDHLYEEVLKEYFKAEEAQTLFRSIMGQLLAAIEPLSMQSLISLRRHAPIDDPEDLDPIPVLETLRRLGSLLSNVTSSDQTHPIVPLHTSFRDFLTNKTSNVFYVDLADAHRQLAHSCLGLMLDSLKFNICKLESSYLANSDVPELEFRIAKHIPSGLSYACIYWVDHLRHLAFDQDIFEKVRSFFETKFLFWLEVLSIKNRVGPVSPVLSLWLQLERTQPEVQDLLGLVHDASAFVRYFGMAVAKSVPHIYVSALPFTPTSSRIRNQYLCQFPHTLTLEFGELSHWPALEMTIYAHDGPVCSVAFSPDGQRIASASSDCTIRVWDATTGEIVAGPFTGHTAQVNCVVFSPDGQHIASASDDCTIRVWDVATGQIVTDPFTGHAASVVSVSFSPHGRRVASASDDCTIRMWDTTTGEVVASPFTGHTDRVRSVAFSPDGQRIASGSDDTTICVWDAATGQIVAGPFFEHTSWVTSVAFSPDGQSIASASFDNTILVWGTTTGEVVAGPFIGHTSTVASVAFSPDGQHIASASHDHTICLWDATMGEIVAGPFTEHTDWVCSVAFLPDGQRIASASHDRTIRVWDITAGQIEADSFTGHCDGVRSIAFSPDGQRIASASNDYVICMWDATSGQMVADQFIGHTDWVRSVAFSPDGLSIASSSDDCTIRVWDAATGQVAADPFTGHTHWVTSAAFSPDGRHIASASDDSTIRMWDVATGQIVTGPLTGHTSSVNSATFSPNGKQIASASSDRTICMWDVATGGIVAGPFTGHTGSVNSVAFSPDGQRLVSASDDATICVWDITTGQIIAGLFTGHTRPVSSAVFSPDGMHIASASGDCTIRMWDATTGDIVAGPFTGHTGWATSVAFSLDGQCIASASHDRTIRTWDVTIGQVGGDPCTGHTSGVRSVEVLSNDTEKILTDQSRIDTEGWICGEAKELFLWIPELHRRCLHRPSTVWVSGGHETRLDLSKFVHGSNWATVHDYNVSK